METFRIESPLGTLAVVGNDEFITDIQFDETAMPDSGRAQTKIVRQGVRELQEYFNSKRTEFNVATSPDGTDFQKKVWNNLKEIDFGKTISYEELALNLGDIKSIRAAGTANGSNKIPIIIPCHRVIGKNGSLVGYAGGLERKEWLLKHEGAIADQLTIF